MESAGAFGSKDEFQQLANDLTAIEGSRRSFADRMETLAGTKEVELTKLRSQIHTAQQASVPTSPKKVVVDDNEPPKKPAKKAVPKPPLLQAKPAATALGYSSQYPVISCETGNFFSSRFPVLCSRLYSSQFTENKSLLAGTFSAYAGSMCLVGGFSRL